MVSLEHGRTQRREEGEEEKGEEEEEEEKAVPQNLSSWAEASPVASAASEASPCDFYLW